MVQLKLCQWHDVPFPLSLHPPLRRGLTSGRTGSMCGGLGVSGSCTSHWGQMTEPHWAPMTYVHTSAAVVRRALSTSAIVGYRSDASRTGL